MIKHERCNLGKFSKSESAGVECSHCAIPKYMLSKGLSVGKDSGNNEDLLTKSVKYTGVTVIKGWFIRGGVVHSFIYLRTHCSVEESERHIQEIDFGYESHGYKSLQIW